MKSKKKPADISYIQKLAKNDKIMINESIKSLKVSLKETIAGIKKNRKTKNYKSLYNCLHKFKPLITYFNMNENLLEWISEIEIMSKDDAYNENKVENITRKMLKELTEISKFLDSSNDLSELI